MNKIFQKTLSLVASMAILASLQTACANSQETTAQNNRPTVKKKAAPRKFKNYGKLPVIKGKSFDGREFSSSDSKYKILIVDFWASWCPPCREEIPGFIDIQKKYGYKVQVIGISADRTDQDHYKFCKSKGVNYPSVMESQVGNSVAEIEKLIGHRITSIPTTLIVNKEGNIVDVHVGYTEQSEFEEIIEQL